jgi:hypothetical protein
VVGGDSIIAAGLSIFPGPSSLPVLLVAPCFNSLLVHTQN